MFDLCFLSATCHLFAFCLSSFSVLHLQLEGCSAVLQGPMELPFYVRASACDRACMCARDKAQLFDHNEMQWGVCAFQPGTG